MKTYKLTARQQQELHASNMNDLIRDMLGKLIKINKVIS